ncbi:MAG: hypothetical protein JWN25_3029 [Verrucomicrobiales bacterium]|nr:hypothetical protein [Verrucomicrobiales bacterium]
MKLCNQKKRFEIVVSQEYDSGNLRKPVIDELRDRGVADAQEKKMEYVTRRVAQMIKDETKLSEQENRIALSRKWDESAFKHPSLLFLTVVVTTILIYCLIK